MPSLAPFKQSEDIDSTDLGGRMVHIFDPDKSDVALCGKPLTKGVPSEIPNDCVVCEELASQLNWDNSGPYDWEKQ